MEERRTFARRKTSLLAGSIMGKMDRGALMRDKTNREAWFFFAVLVLGFLYSNLMRIAGVVVLPPFAESLGIGAGAVGFISSLFFYTYGGSFGAWGIVADRSGSFKTCGISLLIAATGSFVLMFANSVFTVGLGRALSGLGLSSAFTGVLLYSAATFRSENYAFFVGLSMVIGHAGTVLAVAPLGAALDAVGFRGIYLILGLFPLALGLVLLIHRSRDPQLSSRVRTQTPFSMMGFLRDLRDGGVMIWRSFPLRVIGLTWAVSAAAISTLQGLWAVTWLQTTTGAEVPASRMCATWISIGMVVGPAVGGVLTRRFAGERKAFFAMCVLTEASWVCWMLLSLFGFGLGALSAAGFAIGFFSCLGFVFMGNATRELSPPGKNGAAIGMINMLLYMMVIVFQWGTGLVLDLFPSPATPGAYTQAGYQIGFGAIVLFQGYLFYLITKVRTFR